MPEPFVPPDEEEAPDAGDVADADLIAAAEAAIKGSEAPKTEAEKDRDDQGRFVKQAAPPKEKPPEKAPEKPSSVIARELAKREAARAEESQYKTKLADTERMYTQVQQMHEQLQQQQQELARERAALAAARKDPAAFLAQQGWTAEQFINNATQAQNPVYQETVALREELSKRDHSLQELRQIVLGLKAKAEGYDKANDEAKTQAELQEFWSNLPEDSPVWQDYDEKDDIVYFAKRTRQRYYEKTGKVASAKELAQYLHYKALEKRGSSAPTAAQKPNAGKTKAKVPRALGGSDASERRATNGAKHIHDMTPDEERQYLMDIATNAVTGGGD